MGIFHVDFWDKDGKNLSHHDFHNLVTDEGANNILDKYLDGSAYTTDLHMGLISSTDYTALAVTDTAAHINGTNGWKEAGPTTAPDYDEAARQQLTFSTLASARTKTSSVVTFTMAESGSVKGLFVCTVATKDAITGILIAEGLFLEGEQATTDGSFITASYELTI